MGPLRFDALFAQTRQTYLAGMKHLILALSLAIPSATFAEVIVHDPYARVATPMARVGAAFLHIENTSDVDVQLIAVESDAAKRVEIHTHTETDGIMKMHEIEGGITIPAGGMHMLKRGGDHLMFMGLADRWADGDMIPATLVFEHAKPITIEIPVDLDRKPDPHESH